MIKPIPIILLCVLVQSCGEQITGENRDAQCEPDAPCDVVLPPSRICPRERPVFWSACNPIGADCAYPIPGGLVGNYANRCICRGNAEITGWDCFGE